MADRPVSAKLPIFRMQRGYLARKRSMLNHTERKLRAGEWREGFALDVHTISSGFLGYDEFGHEMFDTKRSEIGEALYRLKYKGDFSVVGAIVESAVAFCVRRNWRPDLVVPVPPSNPFRNIQPVSLIADRLARGLAVSCCVECLIKIKDTPQLKDILDFQARIELLKNAFRASKELMEGRQILLFDDLYRSGATARSATATILNQGRASSVYFLALTHTRSKR